MARKVVRLFSLSLLVLVLGPLGVARAETIVVNDGGDAVDDNTANATCHTAAGVCTLRAAIQTANTGSPGPDTITFDPSVSTVTLSVAGGAENASATGDLDIRHDAATPTGVPDVTINGPGPGSLTINGAGVDRVFQLPPVPTSSGFGTTFTGAATATITGLKITGGSAKKDPSFMSPNGDGGAIDSWGTLVLDNVDVNTNGIDATNDSGTCGGVVENDGSVTVRHSSFEDNVSDVGGALCENGGGRVDVSDSTFTHNTTTNGDGDGRGGALLEDGSGVLTATRVLAVDNTANQGGGADEDGGGSVTLTDSTFRGNHAVETIEDRNAVQGVGGGVAEGGAGSVRIERTTINGNDAERAGGGVYAFGGSGTDTDGDNPFDIVNSTITGNTAQVGGGGVEIGDFGGDIIGITSSTINGNTVEPLPISGFASPPHGGNLEICADDPDPGDCGPQGGDSRPYASIGDAGTFNVKNTIVSGGSPANCQTVDGVINSLGHNIDSENSCSFSGTGDQVNTDPRLDALRDNTGPTQTEALLAGSPALDRAGDCPPPSTDQRGIARPQGSACDVGAFEAVVEGSNPPPLRPAVTPAPSCTDLRKFKFHVHHRRGIRIVDVKVFIDGKLRKHVKGHNLKTVTIGKLPQRTFKVRIEQLQSRGGELVSKRTYNGCVKGKPKTKRRHSNKHKHHQHG